MLRGMVLPAGRYARWGVGCRAAGPRCAQAVDQSGAEPVNDRQTGALVQSAAPGRRSGRAAPCRAEHGEARGQIVAGPSPPTSRRHRVVVCVRQTRFLKTACSFRKWRVSF